MLHNNVIQLRPRHFNTEYDITDRCYIITPSSSYAEYLHDVPFRLYCRQTPSNDSFVSAIFDRMNLMANDLFLSKSKHLSHDI